MKKAMSKSKKGNKDKDDMQSEYDFKSMTGGVRGKYYKSYRAGHTVKIKKADKQGIRAIKQFPKRLRSYFKLTQHISFMNCK